MKILVLKETAAHEGRVSITPETIKKLVDQGHEVLIEKDAGKSSGIADNLYTAAGAKISKDATKDIAKVDLVTVVSFDSMDQVKGIKEGTVFVGLMKPYQNTKLLKDLAKKKVTALALELIPRISRAQAMDVLSSQSNLAGYKAVVDSAAEYGRALPMMMTAAGTIPPARVLVLGAGVAGLQAIATAKRMGAVVSAFDVRPAVKEQVESLGASFVEVEADESGDSGGGYAKEMSDDYKRRQSEKLAEVIKNQDIVVTTALIPGKPAPILITANMVKSMKEGSIIYDLAVENGGNCELAEFDKMVMKHGVKIIGHANVPSRIGFDASQVFGRNIFNLLKIMVNSNAELDVNFDDEIIKGCCLTHDGAIVHPNFL
ncbi:Re/Si-specific NAD(P)(+) transhydrogenase subunit alpha [Candidatus Odyssella acanthamoebae]|uniref:NAD(P) transhydrogenase subunit alpha part 1 n=1 Tax=Candidatus Odyssella acanthamoebae TaxID=91604 RepID=A0A077AUD0_9PROT|nr:Re/Si-specific NAD(P)(+) transhydrogenase subunit alpha [Candidatus Paracaedibacter acanthamoebae]AIK95961.1 NAD(P) transhydrogenase subunit alpha [Candidatus Paracaedibacter acanthamoebae]